MRKFLFVTTTIAAASLLTATGSAFAQVYVAADPHGLEASGQEGNVIDTTTADSRVDEPMVEPYLPRATGQAQLPTEDVVGDTAPHPLFIDLAEEERPVPQVAAAPEPQMPDPESLRDKIYFEFDKATLTPQGQAKVDELAATMRTWDLQEVDVAGFADRSGSVSYNEDLSRRRAETVATALRAHGLNPTVLDTQWYGENRPAVPTADGVREQANRRVEVDANE